MCDTGFCDTFTVRSIWEGELLSTTTVETEHEADKVFTEIVNSYLNAVASMSGTTVQTINQHGYVLYETHID